MLKQKEAIIQAEKSSTGSQLGKHEDSNDFVCNTNPVYGDKKNLTSVPQHIGRYITVI